MKGLRSKVSCSLWISLNKEDPATCLMTKVDETKLWHQKIGHLNLKSMKKTILEEAVKGLPKKEKCVENSK